MDSSSLNRCVHSEVRPLTDGDCVAAATLLASEFTYAFQRFSDCQQGDVEKFFHQKMKDSLSNSTASRFFVATRLEHTDTAIDGILHLSLKLPRGRQLLADLRDLSIFCHAFGTMPTIRCLGKLREIRSMLTSPDRYQVAVCHIAVRPERRRIGIGRSLLLLTEDFARKLRKRELIADVRTDNTASRNLFSQSGYIETVLPPENSGPNGVGKSRFSRQLG
jgi:ribosomal protein S18 acetylase RimI-like enzyme